MSKNCVTHHHACDCRESKLYNTLKGIAKDLSLSSDKVAFQAYCDINEMWIDMYGHGILSEKKL